MFSTFIDRLKLPFQKERELRLSLYNIIGFYPHRLELYRQALLHKSVMHRNKKGKAVNNERLEFLGDAILDAIVGDIVFEHFPGKREGFLTNTRSKLVQRDMLNRLADDMGITKLILSNGHSSSHNSYVGGNAFEALVGAIYLDRGYDACMRFMKKRILANMVNIDKVARKEVNFKSKLLEWTQKNRVNIEYRLLNSNQDNDGSPMFHFQVLLEGIACGDGIGYSKKESQQKASHDTLGMLRKNHRLLDSIFAAKGERTSMEEQPVMVVPEVQTSPLPQQEKPLEAESEQSKPAKRNTRKTRQKKEIADEQLEVEQQTVSEEQPAKEKKEAKPRRSRKTTTKSADKAEEKPKRQRRSRKSTSDDTVSAVEQSEVPAVEKDMDFDLSNISHKTLSRDEIIAAAEEAAWQESQSAADKQSL